MGEFFKIWRRRIQKEEIWMNDEDQKVKHITFTRKLWKQKILLGLEEGKILVEQTVNSNDLNQKTKNKYLKKTDDGK